MSISPEMLNVVELANRMITGLPSAVGCLADEMTSGVRSKEPHTGEPVTFAGEEHTRPGFETLSMSCAAVDALARTFAGTGHLKAARIAIASHAETDTDSDQHFFGDEPNWFECLSFADDYILNNF